MPYRPVPPMVLFEAPFKMNTPMVWLMGDVPLALVGAALPLELVPIKLPITWLALVPASEMTTPFLLPEMVLLNDRL